MDFVIPWFKNNLDLVFFVYGLAFVLMGIAIIFQPRKDSNYRIAGILWLLAAFGISHGFHEWVEMWSLIRRKAIDDSFLLALSYLFLYHFGLRLLLIPKPVLKPGGLTRLKYLKLWPYIFALSVGVLDYVSPQKYSETWQILTRYFLAFPGGMMTGFAFLRYYNSLKDDLRPMKIYFLLSAYAFIAYAFLGGLVTNKGPFFPANILNTETFAALAGIPVQVLRALCALTAGASIAILLNIFNLEKVKQRQGVMEKLSEQNQELETLNKKLAEVFSMVSHELKTPLVSIIGFAETLLTRQLPEQDKTKYLKIIQSEGKRIELLINEYMDLSMIETGNVSIVKGPVNIRELMEETLQSLGLQENVKIENRIAGDIPDVLANRSMLRQVIINILGNALKYSPKGGSITITAEEKGGQVAMCIEDEGPGIKEKDIKYIFMKFYRTDTSLSSEIKGLGLGLAIAKGIVEAHNGRIWVESKPGQGSLFCFSLPIAPSA